MIEIVEVKNSKELKNFLDLPKKIYVEENTKYVFPLMMHMKMMMGPLGKGQKHFFVAKKNGQTVARLAAKVHRVGSKKTLNFGFFESLPDQQEAVSALFESAQKLYPKLKMMGPFHFRMEDPYIGVLVEGFEYDPYFLMPYNKPYYDELLKGVGLKIAMDLFTYEVKGEKVLSPLIHKGAKMAYASGVTIRKVNMKKIWEEARTIARIFNDALSKNWGFEEFLDEQVKEMVMLFKLFIDPEVVAIAEKDGKPMGCLIMIPNYNPVIKASRGKITPGLVWRYLRRKKLVDSARGYALGVLRQYHGLGVGSALTEKMFQWGEEEGYYSAEISWVLSNNGPMNELSKAMGGQHSKVYRIYESQSVESISNKG